MTWQPATILFPDAELVMCDRTRDLRASLSVDGLDVTEAYVGRTVPATITVAIVWNRIGGVDPDAFMQARIYAPTDQQATDLARALSAALPSVVDGNPIRRIEQTAFADLGIEKQPMRQLLFDITFRGAQL
ncbi:MAG: hypothetical protein LCH43_11280 [Actinobacteria bacterium]|nr:hypothetical protein [Actinomycetota bacterium]